MKKNGSITVFSALALMLVASFLFALLEAGRAEGLALRAEMVSQLSLESVCAEYQPVLWEDYHLLCLDGAYGGDMFSAENVSCVLYDWVGQNFSRGIGENSLFRLRLTDTQMLEYQLLTDGDGTVFFKRVAEYMKDNLPMEAAKLIYEKYIAGNAVQEEDSGDRVQAAQNALEDAREEMEKENAEGEEQEAVVRPRSIVSETASEVDNPLDIVLRMKQNAVLGMVLEDTGDLSAKEVELSDSLLKRELLQGTDAAEEDISWYEKVLVLEYLDGYFSNYREPAETHALQYEMEYVLCGKESDAANLEGTVNRLLLLREAANMIHILADDAKRESALVLATALASFAGNPAIAKVVQYGVIAAWAYVESILDVRALLAGDQIALIKNEEQWTVRLENLSDLGGTYAKAKNCTNGLSYKSYVKQLLFFSGENKVAYRMMDMMEQNLRMLPAYRECRMDHMLCRMKYRLQYRAVPLFSELAVIGKLKTRYLKWEEITSFSYY